MEIVYITTALRVGNNKIDDQINETGFELDYLRSVLVHFTLSRNYPRKKRLFFPCAKVQRNGEIKVETLNPEELNRSISTLNG